MFPINNLISTLFQSADFEAPEKAEELCGNRGADHVIQTCHGLNIVYGCIWGMFIHPIMGTLYEIRSKMLIYKII
jgi:hypothetical protein